MIASVELSEFCLEIDKIWCKNCGKMWEGELMKMLKGGASAKIDGRVWRSAKASENKWDGKQKETYRTDRSRLVTHVSTDVSLTLLHCGVRNGVRSCQGSMSVG